MSYFLYFGHLFIYLFFFLGFINLIFFIYVFLIFFSLHIKSNGYARLFSSLCSLRFLSHSRFLISLHTPRSDREERPTGGDKDRSGLRHEYQMRDAKGHGRIGEDQMEIERQRKSYLLVFHILF